MWFYPFAVILLRLFAPPTPVELVYGPETTVFNQPRYADGTINYVAALNERWSEGVTHANNAFIEIALTMPPPPHGWLSAEHRQKVFERLEVEPAQERPVFTDWDTIAKRAGLKREPGEFVVPGEVLEEIPLQLAQAIHEDKTPPFPNQVTTAPWSAQDFPGVVKWLAANREAMAMIEEASKKPRYYAPLVPSPEIDAPPMISVLLPTLGYSRMLARLFAARGEQAIAAGELERAWSDVLVIKRLARLLPQQPILITHLVGISLDAMARQVVADIASSDAMTPKLALRMLADLEKLGPLPSMAHTFDTGERFVSLDSIQHTWSSGDDFLGDIVLLGPGGLMRDVRQSPYVSYLDVNVPLRTFNRLYDRLVRAARTDDYQAYRRMTDHWQATAAERLERRRQSLSSPWFHVVRLLSPAAVKQKLVTRSVTDLLVGILLPAVDASIDTSWKNRMHNDLTRIAIALGGHRAEHGEYPAELAALVPAYLDRVPQDLFIDAPLRYRRVNDGGGAVLYSVGKNQQDDGGMGEGVEFGDITVRLNAPAKEQAQ